jgi:hypothetical protein
MAIVRWIINGFNTIDPVNWLHIGPRAVIIHRCLFWLSLVLSIIVMTTGLRESIWIVMAISWWTVYFQHIGAAQSAIATEKAEEVNGNEGQRGSPQPK